MGEQLIRKIKEDIRPISCNMCGISWGDEYRSPMSKCEICEQYFCVYHSHTIYYGNDDCATFCHECEKKINVDVYIFRKEFIELLERHNVDKNVIQTPYNTEQHSDYFAMVMGIINFAGEQISFSRITKENKK